MKKLFNILNFIKCLFFNLLSIIKILLFIISVAVIFILFKCFDLKLEDLGFIVVGIVFILALSAYISNISNLFTKWYNIIFKKRRNFHIPEPLFNKYTTCVLLEGAWGSGKTYYYQHYIKPNLCNPIEISCFGADKEQLVSQLITKSFLWNILSLNGVLSKFFANNWQFFMPKNKIVVFDDLERLHSCEENYLDLIGIIDFLKIQRKCRIILIANIDGTGQIFNAYMERIVDNEISAPKLELIDILESTHTKSDVAPIYKKFIGYLQSLYNQNIKNVRIIKNVYHNKIKKLDYVIRANSGTDEYQKTILAEMLSSNMIKTLAMHYLFYKNRNLFRDCCSFHKNDISEKPGEIENNLNKALLSELGLRGYLLIVNDFINGKYDHNAQGLLESLINFNEHEVVLFAFEALGKLVINENNIFENVVLEVRGIVEEIRNQLHMRETRLTNEGTIIFDEANITYLTNRFHELKSKVGVMFSEALQDWISYIIMYGGYIDKLMQNDNWIKQLNNISTADNLSRHVALAIIFEKYSLEKHFERMHVEIITIINGDYYRGVIDEKVIEYNTFSIILKDYFLWFYSDHESFSEILRNIFNRVHQFITTHTKYMTK